MPCAADPYSGADSVALGSMRSAVSCLQINLEALDKLVADLMVVSELKRGHLRNALITHSESQSLLTPFASSPGGKLRPNALAAHGSSTTETPNPTRQRRLTRPHRQVPAP